MRPEHRAAQRLIAMQSIIQKESAAQIVIVLMLKTVSFQPVTVGTVSQHFVLARMQSRSRLYAVLDVVELNKLSNNIMRKT